MFFKVEDLEELVWSDYVDIPQGRLTKVQHGFRGKRRWSLTRELIFQFGDKFYGVLYDEPATEMQHADFFEGQEEVECAEYTPYETTIIQYKRKDNQ